VRYNGGMRRSFSMASMAGFTAALAVVVALPGWAQGHGGSHGGFSSHSSGSAHVAAAHVSSSSSIHASSGRVFAGHASAGQGPFRGVNSGRGGIRPGRNSYNYRGVYGRRGYYAYGGYYPYGYYAWYADPLYDTSDQDAYADEYGGAPYQDGYQGDGAQGDLQSDVKELKGKVDRLQSDVEARNRPKPEAEPETALVFRDQHVMEVRNYAISGGMVWVLNEDVAKKIPLDQLDLDATVKMNGERGVDFQVPGPTLSIMIVN